ncbi:hypothetical protein BGM26_15410 [Bacillus sp. FJAT-29790]|uniref:hypothetical protein n=1 Tax=Bacillus sp. FJAT-29790 TaxID=1895002 RepID=UPI001C224CA4|nr:hypothetical protein [Bacillus sp. FJAT-29790]MBU8880339.1 hypothetical protein [Bacillus sp. FJAT-29790]
MKLVSYERGRMMKELKKIKIYVNGHPLETPCFHKEDKLMVPALLFKQGYEFVTIDQFI